MSGSQPSTVASLTAVAEIEWLEGWTAGPTEPDSFGLARGTAAPDLVLADHTGVRRSLSEFWADQVVLLMFWHHFGCSCGVDRAKRLLDEYSAYEAAGLMPVIVTQGEPARSEAYRDQHHLPGPVLCDPDRLAYRAYGIGQWSVEQVLYDAPDEYWAHAHDLGVTFQNGRRDEGRPLVDDPWRGVAEFVIGPDGLVRLSYVYQHCEDFPDPRVLTTAARLAGDSSPLRT